MKTGVKVLLSILIIVAGVVIMLGVAGVMLVRQIHVKETGVGDHKTVSVDTPFGSAHVQPRKDLDPSSIGVPIYPGATRTDDHWGAEFQFDSGDFHKEFDVAGALYYSNDDVDKVRQYYEQKFPDWKQKSDQKGDWHLETHEGNRIRSVSVNSESGRTRITVASLGPPASN